LTALPKKRQFFEVECKCDFLSVLLPLGVKKVKSAVDPILKPKSLILKVALPRVKKEMTLSRGK
jgi:hypothetical protein